ncbi:HAMP domain-containing sensor histidine kinase [Eubacteriaceae bacterium ES3]|nr:HAMP domain-containing sensor histidine kinase [Eubacteriaceae bacterium ES3]
MNLLKTLISNEGVLKTDINQTDKMPFLYPRNDFEFQQFITVKTDKNRNIIEIIGTQGSSELTDDWTEVVKGILSVGADNGIWDGYRYLFVPDQEGYILAVVDQRISNAMNRRTLITSLIIGGLGLLVFLFIAIFLSSLLVKPVEEAFDKQKQFISDASHELKTPISVIAINADVLESEIGQNSYLSFIQSESCRMEYLVNDLLILARMDSTKSCCQFNTLDLSQIIEGVVLTFESCAYEAHKGLQSEIQKNINFKGDSEKIKQLMSILLDNAIKYANDGGMIKVILEMKNEHRRLAVYNTGQGICESEKEKIFQRFYRVDASRSKQTGGYGLGLAIAKSIVEAHEGKIWVEGEAGSWICFEMLF